MSLISKMKLIKTFYTFNHLDLIWKTDGSLLLLNTLEECGSIPQQKKKMTIKGRSFKYQNINRIKLCFFTTNKKPRSQFLYLDGHYTHSKRFLKVKTPPTCSLPLPVRSLSAFQGILQGQGWKNLLSPLFPLSKL